jgi:hypothetical protein
MVGLSSIARSRGGIYLCKIGTTNIPTSLCIASSSVSQRVPSNEVVVTALSKAVFWRPKSYPKPRKLKEASRGETDSDSSEPG